MHEGRGNTTIRNRHRKIILRSETHCGWCHEEVDQSLPYLDPGSAVVDHRIPIARGGTDTLDNKQLMHRRCNREKSDRLPGEAAAPARAGRQYTKTLTANPYAAGIPASELPPGVTFITARDWWTRG